MKSWVEKARNASELTPENCASAMNCSRTTYLNREKYPGNLSLDEIRQFHGILSPEGKKIVWNALKEFRP